MCEHLERFRDVVREQGLTFECVDPNTSSVVHCARCDTWMDTFDLLPMTD